MRDTVPMKTVYTLANELAQDPEQISLTQALTLNAARPQMGLSGKFGLFASTEWWQNIRTGLAPRRTIHGVVTRTYTAGQDPGPHNSVTLRLDNGDVHESGMWVNDDGDIPLYSIGHFVKIDYVLEELKRGGVLEMPIAVQVSLPPRLKTVERIDG